MKALIIICLLVVLSSCAYNKTIAKKLSYAAAAAYATEAEISKWSCKTCLLFPLVKVIKHLFRLKLYLTLSWIFMVSQDTPKKSMPLLSGLEVLLIFKIGLLILMPLKSNIQHAAAA